MLPARGIILTTMGLLGAVMDGAPIASLRRPCAKIEDAIHLSPWARALAVKRNAVAIHATTHVRRQGLFDGTSPLPWHT